MWRSTRWECSECGGCAERARPPAVCGECGRPAVFVPAEEIEPEARTSIERPSIGAVRTIDPAALRF